MIQTLDIFTSGTPLSNLFLQRYTSPFINPIALLETQFFYFHSVSTNMFRMLYNKDGDKALEVHVDGTGFSYYEPSLQETRWIFFCTEVQQHITKVSRCDHVMFFMMSMSIYIYQFLAVDCEYTFSSKNMECSLINSIFFIYKIHQLKGILLVFENAYYSAGFQMNWTSKTSVPHVY